MTLRKLLTILSWDSPLSKGDYKILSIQFSVTDNEKEPGLNKKITEKPQYITFKFAGSLLAEWERSIPDLKKNDQVKNNILLNYAKDIIRERVKSGEYFKPNEEISFVTYKNLRLPDLTTLQTVIDQPEIIEIEKKFGFPLKDT